MSTIFKFLYLTTRVRYDILSHMGTQLRPINFNRQYKNRAENAFAETARSLGWQVTKVGYPDFICYRGDDLMLVEVKPKKSGRLKTSQHKLMNALKSKYHVKCYRWSPDNNWLK